jgi:hypothetical protein
VIIRIALLIMLVSLILLLTADLLLWLAMPALPELMTQLGLTLLLGAGALLLLTGLVRGIGLVIRAGLDFFSATQRMQRRLLFIQTRQDQLKQLRDARTLQIRYFTQLQKKRLLNRNNHKHIRALSKAIDNDLLALKSRLPKNLYLQLQHEKAQYRNQHNSEGLLQLQQKITTIG